MQNNDYLSFFKREILERKNFIYPPYYKLIGINLKHKKPDVLRDASRVFTKILKERLGDRVQGPAIPLVERVNTYYILNYLIKMERDVPKLATAKQIIQEATYLLNHTEGYSNVRVLVDVDPY